MEVCDPCHSQFTCSLEQMTGMKIRYLVAHTNQLIGRIFLRSPLHVSQSFSNQWSGFGKPENSD